MVGTVICLAMAGFMRLVQILDGEWNEVFKGSLGFYSWHSVPPSRGEKVVTVV